MNDKVQHSEDEVISASQKKSELKTKLLLSTDDLHPFTRFQTELKNRGVKITDWSDLVKEALEKTSSEWWEEKMEALTPLEYRVNEALADPTMRERLSQLLAQVPSNIDRH